MVWKSFPLHLPSSVLSLHLHAFSVFLSEERNFSCSNKNRLLQRPNSVLPSFHVDVASLQLRCCVPFPASAERSMLNSLQKQHKRDRLAPFYECKSKNIQFLHKPSNILKNATCVDCKPPYYITNLMLCFNS